MGGHRCINRQQSDYIILPLFFKIRKPCWKRARRQRILEKLLKSKVMGAAMEILSGQTEKKVVLVINTEHAKMS
jgi:hypothetical protein